MNYKTVILDWAGTAIDFGCFAPVAAFKKAFERAGLRPTIEETRAPMGMKKWDHIKKMLRGERLAAEFAEKYFHQGIKIIVTGRIQTGSYTNREGNKVYTTDVVVEDQEFAESRNASAENSAGFQPSYQQPSYQQPAAASAPSPAPASADGFMNIPDGIDEELPFN